MIPEHFCKTRGIAADDSRESVRGKRLAKPRAAQYLLTQQLAAEKDNISTFPRQSQVNEWQKLAPQGNPECIFK
jgi:hypothetical protein